MEEMRLLASNLSTGLGPGITVLRSCGSWPWPNNEEAPTYEIVSDDLSRHGDNDAGLDGTKAGNPETGSNKSPSYRNRERSPDGYRTIRRGNDGGGRESQRIHRRAPRAQGVCHAHPRRRPDQP